MPNKTSLLTIIEKAQEKKFKGSFDTALADIRELLKKTPQKAVEAIRNFNHPYNPKVRKLIAFLFPREIKTLFGLLKIPDAQNILAALDDKGAWKICDTLGPKKTRECLGNADKVPVFLDLLSFPRLKTFLESLEPDDLKEIVELMVHDPLLWHFEQYLKKQ